MNLRPLSDKAFAEALEATGWARTQASAGDSPLALAVRQWTGLEAEPDRPAAPLPFRRPARS